jgi:hypothetical protein
MSEWKNRKKKPVRTKQRITISLSKDAVERVRQLAEGQSGGVSGVIEGCVMKHLNSTGHDDSMIDSVITLARNLCYTLEEERRDQLLELIRDLSYERASFREELLTEEQEAIEEARAELREEREQLIKEHQEWKENTQ